MPEVRFHIRWPDGGEERCSSPSRAIEAFLAPGASYPVDEFRARAQAGLEAAGARVQARYGFSCTAASAQVEALERRDATHGRVRVLDVRRAPAPPAFPAPDTVAGHHPVVVIGGGQAGLAMSRVLTGSEVDHLVLERHRVAHAWREERWDEFCLVTPNWQCRLPGMDYAGSDPDGFMLRDEVVAFIERYAASFAPPVLEGVGVEELGPAPGGGFTLRTSRGTVTADQVVLAVGGYHVPRIPAAAATLPDGVSHLHSSAYRNPRALPDGAVLVVGTGQSGAQIAEDLHLAGRDVHLCVGSAPRVARRYRGRDVVAWLEEMGQYDVPVEEHPEGPGVRREVNHYVTGRDGGRDIDLRAFARDGMRLHGRFRSVHGARVALADDLRENLDGADATAERIKDAIDGWISRRGLSAPAELRPPPVWAPPEPPQTTLDLAAEGISTVIWATGFTADWSWVRLPAFDGTGYPDHARGVTSVRGLYVLGLPWLHTWGSGRFAGIARDAEHLGAAIAAGRPAVGSARPPARASIPA